MFKNITIVILLLCIIVLSGCKKDEPGWQYCSDCELSTWTGLYEGEGDYYNGSNDETSPNVLTSIQIENVSGNVLKTTIVVDDKISTSFTSTKNDTKYYYNVPGSNKSLNLNLSTKGEEYKLSGTVKIFHYQKDTLVTDHSISFDAFKVLPI